MRGVSPCLCAVGATNFVALVFFATPRNVTLDDLMLINRNSSSIAERIVREAYNVTYRHIDPCPPNVPMKSCLQTALTRIRDSTTVPWWFMSMLRDATTSGSGLWGGWHVLKTDDLEFCAIEKVGSTMMRNLVCRLNNQTFRGQPCQSKRKNPHRKKIVFLRDPLERFLSGFLNWCVDDPSSGHCMPKSVFTDKKLRKALSTRALFESFVDSPLQWNLHFFPLGFYCDGLYRSLHTYDFVGFMGNDTEHQLLMLGERYGSGVKKAMEDGTEMSYSLHFTSSHNHITEYYTAATVRKILSYHSLDYVRLNLPVPQWAVDMLNGEEKER
mmetsp:Transcript_4471/g.12610  ORF Transcript_4471/g.12610 Transcript_4471/m.12610 type:complete len:327 (+) Transcript_4471:121-1101(+)